MSVLYDNVHFNEAGSRKVAQIISDHLKARAPFVADLHAVDSVTAGDVPPMLGIRSVCSTSVGLARGGRRQ